MKTFAIVAAAFIISCAAQQPEFRHLQQGGGQWLPGNGFPNMNQWPHVGNVGGGQWGNQGVGGFAPEAFPPVGAGVNGAQLPGGQLPEQLEQQSVAPTSPPAVTGTPTATGQDSAAQATIMVLLPDFLAPDFSGSGSSMVLTGESGSQSDHAVPSVPSDAAGAKEKSAAGATAAVTVAAVMLGVAIANLF